jgi:UDP-N-acetylglucosamine 1-carboxyvinyltransferase
MDYLTIEGGYKLSGNVKIGGSKNAALPIIASTILSQEKVTINNLPNVVDIKTLIKLLGMLGAEINYHNPYSVSINNAYINSTTAIYEIVSQMRASILVLGPLLVRFGECKVSLPGGCAIGQRPIDLHLRALEKMGAEILIEDGYIHAKAPNGLKGAKIIFDKITVGGTENILMAGALAKGVTTIINSAKEPEVIQLCEVLINAGVRIDGVGSSELVIYGTDKKTLLFSDISIIPDRIEAGTYLCAGAITKSSITLNSVNPSHLKASIDKLESMGCKFDINDDNITINPPDKLKSINFITSEYPGFPTDMQAQFMALSMVSDGETIIEERLFENRFMHVSELNRLGANICLKGNIASIHKVNQLNGADVMATDLRASSALILAGLIANGKTNVHRIYHLDRGYEDLEGKLSKLGAKIKRVKIKK